MDEGDLEIDVCSPADHIPVNQFGGNMSSQSFNDLSKYEDYDSFLEQEGTGDLLDMGSDPFRFEKCLEDTHILESTLDSILCVTEEEEVIGQSMIEHTADFTDGNEKSVFKENDEKTETVRKKYNMRRQRKPVDNDMFVYDSPVGSKNTVSQLKARRPKKKLDQDSNDKKGSNSNTKTNEMSNSGSQCETDDGISGEDNDTKNPNNSAIEKDKSSEKRLTRRQAQLAGIKPRTDIVLRASKTTKETKINKSDSESGSDESDEKSSSKAVVKVTTKKTARGANKKEKILKNDNKTSGPVRGRPKSNKTNCNTVRQKTLNESDEDFDSYHSDDYEVSDHESDVDYIAESGNDKGMLKGSTKKTKTDREVEQKKTDRKSKTGYKKSDGSEEEVEEKSSKIKCDDEDEFEGDTSDSDDNIDDSEDNLQESGDTGNVSSGQGSNDHSFEIANKMESPQPGPVLSLWEKIEGSLNSNVSASGNSSAQIKGTNRNNSRGEEIVTKHKKTSIGDEKKIKEKKASNDHHPKESSSETKVGSAASSKSTSSSKTISLSSFIQSTTKKGGRDCRGPGCSIVLPSNQKNVYCSQSCINKYSQYSLQVLVRERSSSGQQSGDHSNDRVVVFEKQTGKILTGPIAPTEATLCTWFARHPSFEVMLSSNLHHVENKNKKPGEKKPIPSSLRDNPALSKDIKTMTAKYLSQRKDPDPIKSKVSPGLSSSTSGATGSQSKGPNPIRISVRNVLRELLSNRANSCDDVMVSANEIKSLAMDLEDELFNACEGVNSKYKYKFKAIITQIKDSSNKGFFRRLLFGELQPNQLVKMPNEKIASKELAMWHEDALSLDVLATSESTFPTSFMESTKSPPIQPIFDVLSSVTSETTSQHGMHFFDMNCKICTGKVPEPSYSLHSSKPEHEPAYSLKSQSMESPWEKNKAPSYMQSPAQQTIQKPSIKTPLLPTPVTTSIKADPEIPPLKIAKVMTSYDFDEVIWTGTIFANEITSVKVDTYMVSGSLSSSTPRIFKSILAEELPDTVQMAGRLPPENVCTFISQLKYSGRLAKDVAVVYFQPANSSEDTFYNSLFTYLCNRNRCGVITCGNKGRSKKLKDLYILPLATNVMPPSVLLPFDGPGLPVNRSNLLLGVIIKYAEKTTVSKMPVNIESISSESLDTSQTTSTAEASRETSSTTDEADEEEMLEENKIIFSSVRNEKPQEIEKLSAPAPKLACADDEEPYEPFEDQPTKLPTTKAETASTSNSMVSSNSQNISTSTEQGVLATLPLTVNSVAGKIMSTTSSVANSTSLRDQEIMLKELTDKINEQKLILLQQEQTMKLTSDEDLSNTPTNILAPPKIYKPTSSYASLCQGVTSASSSFENIKEMNASSNSSSFATASLMAKSSSSYLLPSLSASVNHTAVKRSEINEFSEKSPDTSTRIDEKKPSVDAGMKVSGLSSSVVSSNTSSLPSNIFASLPDSINLILSGETLSNLKKIVANASINKPSTTAETLEDKSFLSEQVPKSRPPLLQMIPISSEASTINSSSGYPRPATDNNKSESTMNVHGDFDYRIAAPALPPASSFNPKPPLLGIKPSSAATSTTWGFPKSKPALLATPSSIPLDSIIKDSFNKKFDSNQNAIGAATPKLNPEKDVSVWKPLLPSQGLQKDSCKSSGWRNRDSSRDVERTRRNRDRRSRDRDRRSRRSVSRGRREKRKRSPDHEEERQRKKKDDSDKRPDADQTKAPQKAVTESSAVADKEEQDSANDDVQFVKEEKVISDVIEIEEEEEEGELNDDDSLKKSNDQKIDLPVKCKSRSRSRNRSKNGSKERSRNKSKDRSRNGSKDRSRNESKDKPRNGSKDKPRNGSKERPPNGSKERPRKRSRDRSRNKSRSRPRSHGRRHNRRSQRSSRGDKDFNSSRKNQPSRRSSSKSPTNRASSSKINPLNLPHNLPAIFPSLMQIVSGNTLPVKNANEPNTVPAVAASGIPSLLDLMDQKTLPNKYRKTEVGGLLGKFSDNMSMNTSETKPAKKGLLGDFPSLPFSEEIQPVSVIPNVTQRQPNDSQLDKTVSLNLGNLKTESQKLGAPKTFQLEKPETLKSLPMPPSPYIHQRSNIQEKPYYHNPSTWYGPEHHGMLSPHPSGCFSNNQIPGNFRPSFDGRNFNNQEQMFPTENCSRDTNRDRSLTLLPTPKLNSSSPRDSLLPYPQESSGQWQQQGVHHFHEDDHNCSSGNSRNFHSPKPDNEGPKSFMSHLPLKMPSPIIKGFDESSSRPGLPRNIAPNYQRPGFRPPNSSRFLRPNPTPSVNFPSQKQ